MESFELGDAMFTVLAEAGFNLKKAMKALSLFANHIFVLLEALKAEIERIGLINQPQSKRSKALQAI
jgi:hypothetical protein